MLAVGWMLLSVLAAGTASASVPVLPPPDLCCALGDLLQRQQQLNLQQKRGTVGSVVGTGPRLRSLWLPCLLRMCCVWQPVQTNTSHNHQIMP